jgi:hypothetical protein
MNVISRFESASQRAPNLFGQCVSEDCPQKGGVPCDENVKSTGFVETMSKRRKGYPSETCVKRGVRIVNGNKELIEKLGRNDLCPCGSGKRFKKCCLRMGSFRRRQSRLLLSGNSCLPGPLQSGAGSTQGNLSPAGRV